jgi:hypothetical protein
MSPLNNSETFNRMREKLGKFIYTYMWLIIVLFITCLVLYYRWELRKKTVKSDDMLTKYNSIYKTKINSSINESNIIYQHPLLNYYIKASYNSCCAGNYYNSYVTVKPLEAIIKNGTRFLDFQIYCINGEPVVAASHNNSRRLKGTYNYLTMDEVFSTINDNAFSVPNGDDPLFLNFRIYTDKNEIYPKLAKTINEYFADKLLDIEYGREGVSGEIFNNGMQASLTKKKICYEVLSKLKKRVIIVVGEVENNNKYKLSEEFYQLVNLSNRQGNNFINRRYDEFGLIVLSDEKLDNKERLVCVYPSWSQLNDNYSPIINFNSGCQINLMNFQKIDSNMSYYLNRFDENPIDNGGPTAFILKPPNLRYQGININKPAQQKLCLRQDPNIVEPVPGLKIDKGYDCNPSIASSEILFNDIPNDQAVKDIRVKSFNNFFEKSDVHKPGSHTEWIKKWEYRSTDTGNSGLIQNPIETLKDAILEVSSNKIVIILNIHAKSNYNNNNFIIKNIHIIKKNSNINIETTGLEHNEIKLKGNTTYNKLPDNQYKIAINDKKLIFKEESEADEIFEYDGNKITLDTATEEKFRLEDVEIKDAELYYNKNAKFK